MTKLLAATLALALAAPAIAEEAPGTFKIPGTNTTLKLNGFVEVDVTYDFDGAIEDIRGTDWASFIEFLPLDKNPDQVDQPNRLYMTSRTSRIGFTTNTPIGDKALAVRVEGDFNSPTPFNYSTEPTTNGVGFRLRHAYGEYAGLLVGQTWTNFADLGSFPDTVDFNGHGAFGAVRATMIRYALPVAKGSLSLSLENPQSLVVNTEVRADESLTIGRRYDRLPVMTGSFTMPFEMGHVNVRAVAHEYQGQLPRVDDDGDPVPFGGTKDSAIGWGAGVSGSLKFGAENLVWSVQGGDGLGYYTFQSFIQGAAFVDDQIQTWKHVAYHVGLTHSFSPRLRANLIWSQTFWDKDDELAPTLGDLANERMDIAYANVFFSPFKNAEVGLEYNWGQRTIFESVVVPGSGNDTATQSRVNALVRYTLF